MSLFSKYNIYIQDLDEFFIKTNKMYYGYCSNVGLEINLERRDHQKIYFHYFLVNLCEFIKDNPYNCKIIYYSNNWLRLHKFHRNIIKKVKMIFGLKIWEDDMPIENFLENLRLANPDIDKFETFIRSNTKSKTFKYIKKYLEREGFKALSDTYFRDVANKMLVCN